MEHPARAIARDLAGQAERCCRRYLSNGHREGSYWLVGDVRNKPGRSLYVRLRAAPDGSGSAGKWTDAQSGEHGDLLDIIRAWTPDQTLRAALAEARRFLSLPDEAEPTRASACARAGTPEAARRLIAMTEAIDHGPVATYLAGRGIALSPAARVLRYHPRCWYRASRQDPVGVPAAMPAMIAPVTDIAGRIMGAHRTWLAIDGSAKAAVASPRRAMGQLLGNGVRFGSAARIMAAGEGIESILSLVTTLPALPAIAALSAAHLAALDFPTGLERLYVAREEDLAGCKAFAKIAKRGDLAGVEILPLDARHGDLNADLLAFGREALAERLQAQMPHADRDRFC